MKSLCWLFIFLIAGCSSTQTPTYSNLIYQNSNTDSPSQPVVKIFPLYPEEAFKQGIEGHIKVKGIVTESGKLENIQVIESYPQGTFDYEGLKVLKLWVFKPALIDGKLVKAEITQTLTWRLNDY